MADRFAVEGLLGEGPLGYVYRARRESDGQLVALKLLHENHVNDATLCRRIARAAEAAQGLDHPHAVRVLEHGVDAEGRPFVVSELVQGESLRELMTHSALSPARMGRILGHVLSVLQESHRRGIIHRDLKPENVLVTRAADGGDAVKVSDFGMAPPRAGSHRALAYLAPEERAGGECDGRSDVFAVGMMLYEMLAGALPVPANAPGTTPASEVPPPRERTPGRHIPRELELVCLRAIAPHPEKRFRSAFEMARALKTAVTDLDVRADEPIGSPAFDASTREVAPTASPERMTLPGEQLHSKTRVWLGVLSLAVVCAALVALPHCEALTR